MCTLFYGHFRHRRPRCAPLRTARDGMSDGTRYTGVHATPHGLCAQSNISDDRVKLLTVRSEEGALVVLAMVGDPAGDDVDLVHLRLADSPRRRARPSCARCPTTPP